MIIVVLGFVMLGTVMLAFFSQYWQNEQKTTLRKNADLIAGFCELTLFVGEDTEKDLNVLGFVVNTYAESLEANVLATNLKGEVFLENSGEENPASPRKINQSIVDAAVQTGCYEEKGKLEGIYETDSFTVGVPLVAIQDDGSEQYMGAVFVSKNAASFDAFQREATQIFLIAAVLALGISFIVVGFFAYNLVKPLRQVSAAVNRFGNGDFSVRVPVTSQDEIGQLAVSFNNMADSLSNGESMRRSFIANVSHELKTPMTTIAGFVDGILDGTIPESQREKYMTIVSEEVKRLSRLVKSMLDLSRIDSGEMKINLQKFDLPGMIVKILLTFEQSVEEKNLEIEGLEDVGRLYIYGDQDLLYQVVYNLIENAVKFTNENGYIRFSIIDGIDRTSVVVENSGEGIQPEELSMIFDRFYKADKSRSIDKKGMGLGLYIVKTIIQLHGGDIAVSSQLGEYVRFEFYIPKVHQESHSAEDKDKTREFTVYDAEISTDTGKLPQKLRDRDKKKE